MREAERRRYAEDEAARASRIISTVGAAAHIYARHAGQVGERPPAAHLARAVEVLGPRFTAYFQALCLSGRRVPLMPLTLVGDAGREHGFFEGIKRDLDADLDLWAGVRGLEEKAADLAKRINKPVAAPIAIPVDIQDRLLERDRLRADRVGGAAGRGAVRVTPETAPDAVPVEEPETGSKGMKTPKGSDDEEEAEKAPPPAPEDAAKPSSDDNDEPPKGPGKP
ncbi:MAG: hypothetical protein EOP19_00090 [Hyphomicrobiales bacterium]|nr:MAG: hypothetical protein EOP19_00090 [Hyphomicrobiales bacterium]